MTTMFDLGEKAFLKSLLPRLEVAPSFVNGFGHDASIIDLGFEEYLAFKIDRAPFPVALHRGIGDFRTWGRLAVVANVSDLLAVGAIPRALMLSLVLPGEFDAENARAIVEGCEEACAAHDIAFVGGDTKEGKAAQVVGAAWGTVAKNAVVGRALAGDGDRLFVAGFLGAFVGALKLMDACSDAAEFRQEWIQTLTLPSARMHEARFMRQAGMVAAACDLSDGLADALEIFCGAGVGITLEESKMPMHSQAVEASRTTGLPLWRFALGVGDWAIAFVVREKDVAQFRLAMDASLILHEIGRFNNSGRKVIREVSGAEKEVPNLINEQFRKRLEDDGIYMRELLRPI